MKKQLHITARTTLATILAAGICLVSTAPAAEETKSETKAKSELSANDKKFVKKAYMRGLTEVANAKVAKEKAKEDTTREVAERMIADHGAANDRLMEIAKEESLDLSEVAAKPASIAEDGFDKKYLAMLKQAHTRDIATFEKEAADKSAGEDADVPAFAKKTLPTLKEHLQMVEDALAKMK